jgi:hypothetical protein
MTLFFFWPLALGKALRFDFLSQRLRAFPNDKEAFT